MLRLSKELTDAQLEKLNDEFADIVASGRIERAAASPAEIADGDAVDRPRIRFRFIDNSYARLHAMIRLINTF